MRRLPVAPLIGGRAGIVVASGHMLGISTRAMSAAGRRAGG